MPEDIPTPSITQEIQRTTEELEIRLDELLAPLYFKDLLKLAENVCLTTPPRYPEHQQPTGEARIVALVGSRGLKSALELSSGLIVEHPYEYLEGEDETNRPIHHSMAFRHTELFSRSIDFDVLSKAEAFGDQLITESFRILGNDAYQKAEQYSLAKSADEQMKIINWLDRRMRALTHAHSTPLEAANDTIYNPARLSPKLTGVYPHTQLEPTCLGVSVIATSFFRKAGISKILHGDVTRTNKDTLGLYTVALLDSLPEYCKELGVYLSPSMEASLETIHKQISDFCFRLEAHHAAVYTELIDGTWAQFDSNYRASVRIDEDEIVGTLRGAWDRLTATAPFAPGIETSAPIHTICNQDLAIIAKWWLADQSAESFQTLSSAIEATLASLWDAESLGEKIYEIIKDTLFSEKATNSADLNFFNKSLTEVTLIGTFEDPILESTFHKLFTKYVLLGLSPEAFLERIKHDASYSYNRLQDICALPLLMIVSIARESFMGGGGEEHSSVELGLPEQRIGLAVLSDFATYTDSPLTPSFWISHWPGNVSVSESLIRTPGSYADGCLVHNTTIHTFASPLTSVKNKDIISAFVSAHNARSI